MSCIGVGFKWNPPTIGYGAFSIQGEREEKG